MYLVAKISCDRPGVGFDASPGGAAGGAAIPGGVSGFVSNCGKRLKLDQTQDFKKLPWRCSGGVVEEGESGQFG